jgi:alanine racemase
MTVHDPDLKPITTAPSGPSEAEAGGILTIDLSAIAANWKKLSGMTLPVECAAVVKGDGYGCGLDPVTRTLAKAGCTTFFVADVAEGRRVRAIVPDATIYVLNGVMPGTAQSLADANLRPVINSATELSEWDAFVSIKGWRGGAALHVDTGMNRLGISPDEAIALAPRLQSANHGFTLVMSHLACAEIPDHPLNDRQIRMFREIRIMFRGLPSSLANSSGIFLGSTTYCDLVRPGIALYGSNPTPGRPNPMRPVVELKGRIVQLRHIPRGETIGYDATFQTARDSRIATVALGYADGFLRSASAAKGKDAAQVVIAGRRCPIVGRVSMDLLTVDVTDLPEGSARRGGLVTLIGDGLDVDQVGAAMGSISYEVLTALGKRYHRIYKGG